MADRLLIEQYAAAAWPAGEASAAAGWLLRHTPGVPRRRSNSALPLVPGAVLLAGLPWVEEYYRERGLPVVVQVAPAEEHTELDAALAGRGYRREAPTLVRTAPAATVIARSRPSAPLAVTVAEEATRHWLDGYVALDGGGGGRAAADGVLARIPGRAAYLSVERDGAVVGIGLFVAASDPAYAGVFCMATHPDHRRGGIATAVLHVGARWAAARGAERLYLQVMADEEHAPARRLYERVGFQGSHGYHYRSLSSSAC
ncbi:GNAT family N-acetyltransferase [Kitasatospora sp. RG8]|uniref:GNAT family N-acetyltransferase n=1 Tax=Kitasatospora sp. RG8 TaxID=2820815 RepID=UPI001AE05E46|nr:GNAT family N-acetyltransferase [Kitasatospora sp. RG8]MBP0454822.1 GNAT family N-acetyltransferase [Kitasatospora sp. RG8]